MSATIDTEIGNHLANIPPSGSIRELAWVFSGYFTFATDNSQRAITTALKADIVANPTEKLNYEKVLEDQKSDPTSKYHVPASIDLAGKKNWGFMNNLYYTLASVFPANREQYLSLQLPAQPLNRADFLYEIRDSYSTMAKPRSVAEAEFRLADQTYPVGPLILGPTGGSLSETYFRALDRLIPKYDQGTTSQFRKDQAAMREWLRTPQQQPHTGAGAEPTDAAVAIAGSSANSGADGGNGNSRAIVPFTGSSSSSVGAAIVTIPVPDIDVGVGATPMSSFISSTNAWISAKQAWDEERDTRLKAATDPTKPDTIEEYCRFISTNSLSHNFNVELKYTHAVLQGYYHQIRNIQAFMDTEIAGERLQQARQRIRACMRSMADQSSEVYPVYFNPSNWADSLRTDFAPEDLLQSPDVLQAKLQIKSSLLDRTRDRILTLISRNKSARIAELSKAYETARSEARVKESELTSQYTQAGILALKTYIKYQTGGISGLPMGKNTKDKAGFEKMVKDTGIDKPEKDNPSESKTPIDTIITEFSECNDKVIKATEALMAANEKVVETGRDKAEAIVRNNDLEIKLARNEVKALESQVQELCASLEIALTKKQNTVGGNGDSAKPTLPPSNSAWQTTTIEHHAESKTDSSDTHSEAHRFSWNVSLLFGSGKGSSDSNSASDRTNADSSSVNIDVAFRSTLVNMSRPGWFAPELFRNSGQYYRLTDEKFSGNFDLMSRLPDSADIDTQTQQDNKLGLLPVYATSILLVKDVMIKFKCDQQTTATLKKHAESVSSSGGGFLCFSVSRSDSSKDDSSAMSVWTSDEGVQISIPGPQIMGYIMQKVPEDMSEKLEEKHQMPNDYLPGLEQVISNAIRNGVNGNDLVPVPVHA